MVIVQHYICESPYSSSSTSVVAAVVAAAGAAATGARWECSDVAVVGSFAERIVGTSVAAAGD